MTKKTATLIKLPRPWIVVMDGKIVGFARSGYNATEVADFHGAEIQVMEEWKLGQSLSLSTSSSDSGSSSSRTKRSRK